LTTERGGGFKIDAIILAGGLGTRLKAVASDLPKVLLPVNGKPFLDIILDRLSRIGKIRRVILAVGYMADKIIQRYKDSRSFCFGIDFSVETELLGTGGAVKKALGYVKTDDVLVLNGDSYVDVDVEELYSAHMSKNAAMTIVLKEMPDAGRYGSVLVDADGRVTSFEEKKDGVSGGYINAGVYLFKRNLFDSVDSERVLSLERDLLPLFLRDAVYGFVTQGKFIDIGIPEAYRMVGEYLDIPSPLKGEGQGEGE
jgi:D-glycero-alpha-D-manno-heptose 1-phosphate guanylyltransferase